MSDHRPEYRITIRAEPTAAGDAPPVVRLRRWLKLGLRSFGLRCIDARELHDGGADASGADAANGAEAAPEASAASPGRGGAKR